MDTTLTIVGTGRLGEALLAGLLGAGTVDPARVVCTARRPERLAELAAIHGVRTSLDNAEAVAQAQLVVLGLKPQALPGALATFAGTLRADQTVVSLAAGVTTATIEAAVEAPVPVVRVMTNTPVHVGEAMSVLAGGRHATEDDLRLAEEVLAPVGRVLRLDEDHFDAVTAVSGSGPAYVFYLAEALLEAAGQLGLPQAAAVELTAQTVAGAGLLLRGTGTPPDELRAAVTSPGGTTAAAIGVLERGGTRQVVRDAVAAAARRSAELSAGE